MKLRGKPRLTRRRLLQGALAVAPAAALAPKLLAQALPNTPARHIASGPFQPTWPSLRAYKTPDWFRDAKFGIWAHWSAQCVPEQGDWYARRMYLQGDAAYDHHLKTYGHPSKSGFMEIDNLWKAQNWRPEQLMDLYVAAGAKYFVSLACHHDNLDTFDSRYHAWNTTRVGPKKDIVGTWAKIARARGLRFGVSDHASHAWHWFQPAYDYDPVGPLAGVRYDAYRLTKADGRGKWWDGLDPQELYTGRNLVMPDGVASIDAAKSWHSQHDAVWNENPPPNNPEFVNTWFLRCQDLMDKYQPDLIYFDDTDLPLGQAGLDVTAHFYNSSIARHGSLQCVVNGKKLKPDHTGAVTLDIERGRSDAILPEPWQTDTCIGDWHYKRSIFENHTYKTPATVIHMLIDIVSKNGNLLLSIPVRGDGTIDEDEHAFLQALATWMPVHGEAIYGTRPFAVFGEGPPEIIDNSNFNEKQRPYTSEDIRFTTKGSTLYAFALAWPDSGSLVIKTLATGAQHAPANLRRVELLGAPGDVRFTRTPEALTVTLPSQKPNPYAWALRIQT
jgi:alpha-L-fucosidase